MNEGNDKSEIDKLQDRLYAKKEVPEFERSRLHQKHYDVKQEFASSKREEAEKDPFADLKKVKLRTSPFLKLFYAALVFLILALCISGYIMYSRVNVISANKIQMSVAGPKSITAGEKELYQISIKNNNSAKLAEAELRITFPEGTRDPNDPTKKITHVEKKLGDIGVRETKSVQTEVVFYGSVDDNKDIHVQLTYRLKNGSAEFTKKTSLTATIRNAPVSVGVDVLHSSPTDQKVTLKVHVRSNTDKTMSHIVLSADYPRRFTLSSAVPETEQGDHFWKLGSLKPGEEKIITVNGVITGATTVKEVFTFTVGKTTGEAYGVSIPYVTAKGETVVEPPFMLAKFDLRGLREDSDNPSGGSLVSSGNSDQDVVRYQGSSGGISGSIDWQNNVPSKITNVNYVLHLKGGLINKHTTDPGKGFYDSTENTITWNGRTTDALSIIPSGKSGTLPVRFRLFDAFTPESSSARNPTVDLSLSVSGNRISESGAAEHLQAYYEKHMKVQTVVDFQSHIAYFTSPFSNTGPMPPRVGKETTYTVFWTLKNSFNDVSGATVSAKLPAYVSWVGKFTPQKEDLTFNSYTGVVTWNVGTLQAGTGSDTSEREVAFQISLVPSLTHAGAPLGLIKSATFTGTDEFTQGTIRKVVDSLTTQLPYDTGANGQSGMVQE